MPYETFPTERAVRKATGQLVCVHYLGSHPAEGSRYEILDARASLGYGEVVFGHELSFDPFAIVAAEGSGGGRPAPYPPHTISEEAWEYADYARDWL